MTVLTWLVLLGIAVVLVGAVAAQELPDGTAAARRAVGLVTVLWQVTVLCGLSIAALHIVTRTNSVCPTDASCSVPYSGPALVLAPLLVLVTASVARTGYLRSWPLRILVPTMVALGVTVLLLVVAGATYRIDVPRP